jgi:membrane protease YdiL (CAAX protease family)
MTDSHEPERADESPEDRAGAPVPFSPAAQTDMDSGLVDPLPHQAVSIPPAGAGLPADGRLLAGSANPLRWADLVYLLIFYFVSGTLLELVVAGAAAIFFHVSYAALQNPAGAGASVAIVSQALLSAATLAFLYVMVRARTSGPFWRALGWRRLRDADPHASAVRYMFLGLLLALVVGWTSKYVDTGKTLPMEELFHNRQNIVLLTLLGVLVAPLVEETLFRGCIYPVVARRFGAGAGVLATGILFGLAHAPQLWGGWGEIALLVCVGIVLTYVRARAGTVAASYFVHVSYNTILFAGLYFATSGLRYFPST